MQPHPILLKVQGHRNPSFVISSLSAGVVDYTDYTPAVPHPHECSGYNAKLQLMVRFQSWIFVKCRVALNCYYFPVLSDPDYYCLLRSSRGHFVGLLSLVNLNNKLLCTNYSYHIEILDE